MRVIGVEERRARLAVRHRLLPRLRTDDLAQVAEDLVALHSSDPVTVYLSALARMTTPSLEAVSRALYEDRSLVRHHAMRRTLWVSTPPTVQVLHAAATRALVQPERRRTCQLLAASGVSDPESWLDGARDLVLDDLATHGPSTARELGQRIRALARPLQLAPGTQNEATQAAHTRVMLGLGFAGEVVRVQPTGSWVNGAYRYALAEEWVPGGLGDLDGREAAATLADRYLQRFGPATTVDLQWWTGWTKTATVKALADCGAVPVEVEEGRAWLSAADEGAPEPEPWIAALPSLDPTTMGWKQRDWYLPPRARHAFDRMGNAGPTVWVDGEVAGVWAQAPDGEIRTHWFADPGPVRRAEVTARAAEVADLVGDTRFTVRFPSPVSTALTRGVAVSLPQVGRG
jgi:hypothetical protein